MMRCDISSTPLSLRLHPAPAAYYGRTVCCAARLGSAATVGRHHCRRALRPIASLPSRNKQSACCSVHSVSACIHPDCIELKWMNASRKEGGDESTCTTSPRPQPPASQQCASVPCARLVRPWALHHSRARARVLLCTILVVRTTQGGRVH